VHQFVPAVIAQANTRLVHPVILIFGDRGCSLAVVYWVVPGNRPFHFRDHIHAVITLLFIHIHFSMVHFTVVHAFHIIIIHLHAAHVHGSHIHAHILHRSSGSRSSFSNRSF